MDKLFVRCQLCFGESVLTYSPFDEALCDWCKNFVKIKRAEGLSTPDIIKAYKNHPRYNSTNN